MRAVLARMTGSSVRVVRVAVTLGAVGVEVLPWRLPVAGTVAGLWLVLVAPAMAAAPTVRTAGSNRLARWLLAGCLALITAIVVALLVNWTLPVIGVARPLSGPALAIGQGVAIAAWEGLGRRVAGPAGPVPVPRVRPDREAVLVVGLGLCCLVGAVAGAIRLNNGLGSTGSLVTLVLIAGLLGLLLWRRNRHSDGLTAAGLCLAAAALLLLTSLRGWYITGHDIQREFVVYQITSQLGRWAMSSFPDPYNACLSITLLPTSLSELTGIPGLYVFKAVLPLLFAATPVMVYRTGRNIASRPVALLGAVYFVAFPTFFTDMTFLGRQEIAFLLLGCAFMVLSDVGVAPRPRRLVFVVLLAGIVLSHYSTTYVLIGMLVVGKVVGQLLNWIGPLRRRLADRVPQHGRGGFVGWWMVGAVVVAAALWTGPVTNTWQQVERTTVGVAQNILDPSASQPGSSDTGYSLFSGGRVSPQQRLRDYAATTAQQTSAGRATGTYEPAATVESAAVSVAPEQLLPLTGAGQLLSGAGLDVAGVNAAVRQVFADLLQVLLLVGLVGTVLLAATTRFRPDRDLFTLSVAAVLVLGTETVLPQLSVDYGVLRTFQQGLLCFAPFIAVASIRMLRWLRRYRVPSAGALALFFFLDLTGVLPKLTGGSPPQLQLDNAGQYYDIYYLHPQERSAISWVDDNVGRIQPAGVQSEVQTDRYTFSRVQTLLSGRAIDDIYPNLIRTNSFVFLGYTTVTRDQATVFYQGDLITYQYPIAFLDTTKNKIYSSDGASVYR